MLPTELVAQQESKALESKVITLDGDSKTSNVAISNDGTFIVVVCRNGDLLTYGVDDAQLACRLPTRRGDPHVVLISPDNKTLAVGRNSGVLRLFSIDEQLQLRPIASFDTPKSSAIVCFSGDSRKLYMPTSGIHRIYDIEQAKTIHAVPDDYYVRSNIRLGHSTKHGGQAIVVTTSEAAVIDFESEAVIQRMSLDALKPQSSGRWAISTDGKRVLYARDKVLKLLDLTTGEVTGHEFDETMSGVHWLNDNKTIIATVNTRPRSIRVIDGADLTNVKILEFPSTLQLTTRRGIRSSSGYHSIKTSKQSSWIVSFSQNAKRIVLLNIRDDQ